MLRVWISVGPLNLLWGAGNLGKIWYACVQHEFQYTEWKMNKSVYNFMHDFNCVYIYLSCAVKNIIMENIYKQCLNLG